VLLRDKRITGLMKSFSLVDSTLTQQGFRRCGREERPTYQLTIQDSATRSSYFLKIPTTVHHSAPGNIVTHIGRPYMCSKSSSYSDEIPLSIRQAVESKLAEIADYLLSHKN
jgi:hypothetical protein